MRYLFLITYAVLLHLNTSSQNTISKKQFIVAGKFDSPVNGIVYLVYVNAEGHYITDSSLIFQQSFVFKGAVNCYYNADLFVKETDSAHLVLGGNIRNFRFGLENKKINFFLSGSGITKMKVTGNTTEKAIANFQKEMTDPVLLAIEQLENSSLPGDSIKINTLVEKYKRLVADYCTLYSNSNTATFILFDGPQNYFTTAERRSVFIKLSQQQQNSYFGKFLERIMYRSELKHSQVGLAAANFKTIDYRGDSIDLNSLARSGYVLLDFWASWCNPCRFGHPGLRRLYQKYHKYGFSIIGISCDVENDEVKWKNAIREDSVFYWPQIVTTPPNMKKMASRPDLLRDYQVSAFPTQILIDSKNKIVFRVDGENELGKKLKEIYGE